MKSYKIHVIPGVINSQAEISLARNLFRFYPEVERCLQEVQNCWNFYFYLRTNILKLPVHRTSTLNHDFQESSLYHCTSTVNYQKKTTPNSFIIELVSLDLSFKMMYYRTSTMKQITNSIYVQDLMYELCVHMDRDELSDFLEGILTPKELREIPLRLQIVRLLKAGKSQREVAEKLQVAIATVSRGARELQLGRFSHIKPAKERATWRDRTTQQQS